jgi:hypothetical protein
MKTTLIALFFLCTTAALAQSGAGTAALSNEPYVFRVPSHDARASQQPMQLEQSLLVTVHNTSAQGERPLWEVGAKPPAEIPLGDVARLYRDQHTTVRKARKVLEQ